MSPATRRDITPWETDETPEHRKELAFLNNRQHSVAPSPTSSQIPPPPQQQQPPPQTYLPQTAAPILANSTSSPFLKEPQFGRSNRPRLPPSVFSNNGFNLGDDLGAMSPGFHPPNNNEEYLADTRRPSVASTSTTASTSSKRSVGAIPGRFHKKLQGFFGEDIEKMEDRHNSDSSQPQSRADGASIIDRQGSIAGQRPSSRASSMARPRDNGPGPSSEVTPWDFQDADVSLMNCPSPLPPNPARCIAV